MVTLLEIYKSFENGQKRQFADQVNEYGADEFAADIENKAKRYEMLKAYIIMETDSKG